MAEAGLIGRTFVMLADTLVADYDVVEFLDTLTERCVDLLPIAEAGVVLVDPAGNLRVMASSSERMRSIELFEVQNEDGPCRDAWQTASAVQEQDLAGNGRQRWPRFAPVALEAGFRAVYACPMRLRGECIGALNLFVEHSDGLAAEEHDLAQALADVATIGIIHERLVREQAMLSEQLQIALNSRIVIEQAKGVVAAQLDSDVDGSFVLLRGYARRHSRRLTEVATDVVQRRLAGTELAAHELDAPSESERRPAK